MMIILHKMCWNCIKIAIYWHKHTSINAYSKYANLQLFFNDFTFFIHPAKKFTIALSYFIVRFLKDTSCLNPQLYALVLLFIAGKKNKSVGRSVMSDSL